MQARFGPLASLGKHSIILTAEILRLSEDLPMIVKIADMIEDRLVTLERVRVIQCTA